MKVIWEPSDIFPGRRVGVMSGPWNWVIGYHSDCDSIGMKYALIRLKDGEIGFERTPTDMADYLTQTEYLPIQLINQDDI